MGVKYSCTKCSKKFVDWGAKKIKAGKGCEDCKGEFLELVGFDGAQAAPKKKKKPTLKRKRAAAKKKPKPVPAQEDSELEPDLVPALPDGATDDAADLDDGGAETENGSDSDAAGSKPERG